MAYDKHVWTCGEAITTEKLNHMENGIANADGGGTDALVVTFSGTTSDQVTDNGDFPITSLQSDYTASEILEALKNGQRVKAFFDESSRGEQVGFSELLTDVDLENGEPAGVTFYYTIFNNYNGGAYGTRTIAIYVVENGGTGTMDGVAMRYYHQASN